MAEIDQDLDTSRTYFLVSGIANNCRSSTSWFWSLTFLFRAFLADPQSAEVGKAAGVLDGEVHFLEREEG